jgi:hypothetical protein
MFEILKHLKPKIAESGWLKFDWMVKNISSDFKNESCLVLKSWFPATFLPDLFILTCILE